MADSIDHDAMDDCDDEAPTRLQRTPRVQLHPKLDPRRVPTLRRLAVVRSLAAPTAHPAPPTRAKRGGVSLTWVVIFVAASYLSILVAVLLALR